MMKTVLGILAIGAACAAIACNQPASHPSPGSGGSGAPAASLSSAPSAPDASSASSAPAAQQTVEPIIEIPPDEKSKQFDSASGHTVLKEALALIRVPDARKEFSVSGAGLAAAVLDTGLLTTHVDFRGRVPAQVNFTPDNGGAEGNAKDGEGHGTNVAGIIAASEDPPAAGAPKGEHTGAAPKARIIPIKVLKNDGKGDFGWVASALQWVLDNAKKSPDFEISVVNLSLGDRRNRTTDAGFENDKIKGLIDQLRAKRIAVVIAAGNEYFGANPVAGKPAVEGMGYPAILRASTSVGAVYDANIGGVEYASGAVAKTTAKDQLAAFSQRFHESSSAALRTDVFAPGAAITSSGINNNRGESVQQGTSQAAPITAGVILLLQEFHKKTKGELPTVDDLEKWIREGSVEITDDCTNCDNVPHTKKKFRRIDAVGALTAAKKAIQPS
jgi:hypothetical protein